MGTNTARIHPVDQPESGPWPVTLDGLQRCPNELCDKFWLPSKKRHQPCMKKGSSTTYCKRGLEATQIEEQQCPGVTLGLCNDPNECAQAVSRPADCRKEAGATDSTRSGGEGFWGLCGCQWGGGCPKRHGKCK